jgi:hypothetical protein
MNGETPVRKQWDDPPKKKIDFRKLTKHLPDKEQVRVAARKLSVPQILAVLCLLALGLNGLVQVSLQRDMAEKATLLQQRVAETEAMSVQMKDGLGGLTELQQVSAHMAGTLQGIQAETGGMNQDLAELEQTVGGIGTAIEQISASTKSSGATITATKDAASGMLGVLRQVSTVNSGLIDHLNGMKQDQQRINNALAEMNRKTAILPSLGR